MSVRWQYFHIVSFQILFYFSKEGGLSCCWNCQRYEHDHIFILFHLLFNLFLFSLFLNLLFFNWLSLLHYFSYFFCSDFLVNNLFKGLLVDFFILQQFEELNVFIMKIFCNRLLLILTKLKCSLTNIKVILLRFRCHKTLC